MVKGHRGAEQLTITEIWGHESVMTLTWKEWRAQNRSKMQSYEPQFATNILEHVPGLSPSDVHCQYPFVGEDGRPLHMDFAIVIGDNIKIAIELNGRDKTGSGQAKTSRAHDHDEMRLRALSRQGWKVIHYSNNDFLSREITVRSEIALDIEEARMRAKRSELPRDIQSPSTVTAPSTVTPPTPPPPPPQESTRRPERRKHSKLTVTLITLGCAVVLGLILVVVFANASPQGNLANPGNTKDCSDFATQREAQAWFDKYYDQFGDVAELDGDGDGIVGEGGCTSG